MRFDPDALLDALPKRAITPLREVRFRASSFVPPSSSALGQLGEYNGFTDLERKRTARLSNRLAQLGATARPASCDICGNDADDEHAEIYYDLTRWVGLCVSCHRHTLHKRFKQPQKWLALLDRFELPPDHWCRLVPPEPIDLAVWSRDRGLHEPTMADFLDKTAA